MSSPLLPREVFTPNAFPLKEHNVYASREHAETSLDQGLGRSRVPLVYGEYGVGKTTLVKKHFVSEDEQGRLVHFLTPAGKNVDDLARVVLEQIGYRVEVGRSQRDTSTLEGSIQTSFLAPLTAKLLGRVEQTEESQTELVVTTPTDQGLLELTRLR